MSDKSLFGVFMNVATTVGMSVGAGFAIATLLNWMSLENERSADAHTVVPVMRDTAHDETARFTQYIATHYPPATTPVALLRRDLEVSGFSCTAAADALTCEKIRPDYRDRALNWRWKVVAALQGDAQALTSVAADVSLIRANAR